jgi:acetoin utilization deacetylase AcuC-like enzyme
MQNLNSHILHVVYSEDHELHAPIYDFDDGRLLPYVEAPIRARNILSQLSAHDFTKRHEINEMITEDKLAETHSMDLIVHIKNTSKKAASRESNGHEKDIYLFPYLFPIRNYMHSKLVNSEDDRGCFAFDTYAPIGKGTWNAVRSSASVALKSANMLLSNKSEPVYAICRPPGHHAGIDYMGGYCYLNNAAIAANHLKKTGKVAIIDIDYHHGNGTQEIFWNDNQVFFGSIHGDPFEDYPNFSGYAEEKGGTNALNTNLNIPLPLHSDDNRYLAALNDMINAVAQFEPDWLIVSTGFDTRKDDPVGNFDLTQNAYHQIGQAFSEMQLPTLFIQEGGYIPEEIGYLAEQLVKGFLGR